MSRKAIVLHEGRPGPREVRLGRILDFFGVPWDSVAASEAGSLVRSSPDFALFGSVEVVACALNRMPSTGDVGSPFSFYAYAGDRITSGSRAHPLPFDDVKITLDAPSTPELTIRVSNEHNELTGPMAGLEISFHPGPDDFVLSGSATAPGGPAPSPIISADQGSLFVRLETKGHFVYLCASAAMVDIEQPITKGFYDIKDHFCSAVPLIMFIKQMFPETSWHPQELGACLIIDDPLLKSQYGHCNFPKMRDLMREHGFTTNIAFIPWNWRRTTASAGTFFRNEADLFSVSIHGCDHTAREFGALSLDTLQRGAQLAQSRMRKHFERTGVRHDPIMVFPQGVFSSACPGVLQGNGFLAAVNTEIVPVDSANACTRIRDVWDVAIMAYDGFPIFTRRYAVHGIENFAFDLMLGKPCLIVAHHDFLRDGGARVVELVERIRLLHCTVQWKPLGEVIRRACRRHVLASGMEELEMYGDELVIANTADHAVRLKVRKRKGRHCSISGIVCRGEPVVWTTGDDHDSFEVSLQPRSEERIKIAYQQPHAEVARRSLGFEIAVAVRRILSEFRDDYLSTNRFLSHPAHRVRNLFQRAH